jgi:hypothetical protein
MMKNVEVDIISISYHVAKKKSKVEKNERGG